MALITITSDLGTRDFYVAAIKGAIITNSGFVNIIDVTHHIKPFDIKEAAFTVKNMFRYYPKGTIHIVHVNSTDSKGKLLLALVDGHYFLTFDNGFLSLAFEQMPRETYEINTELLENASLLYEAAISKVVHLLVKEFHPSDFTKLTTETIKLRLMQPITSNGSIRGTVINIDNFGNATVNITKAMFEQYIGEKQFTITANVGTTKEISKKYSDMDEEADMICLFNSSGYLEIALNKAKAVNLLGLKIDFPILVAAD